MNGRLSKLTIYQTLIGLAVVAQVMVGLAVLLAPKGKPTADVAVEPDSEIVEPDPEVRYFEDLKVQSWVTFVDAEMGFSISHPPEWIVRKQAPDPRGATSPNVLAEYVFIDPRFGNSEYAVTVVLNSQTLDRVLQAGGAHLPGGPYDYHINVNGIPGRLIGGPVHPDDWYPIPDSWAFYLETERWTATILTTTSPWETFRVATTFSLL